MKKLLLFGAFVLLLFAGALGLKWMHAIAQASQQQGNPLFPPEMNAARDAKEDFVIGELGGVPVRIPGYFANYVQYEGDPGFGEKRMGSIPVRTYKSKIESFGFKVRIPDMAGRSSPELWKDYGKYQDFYWEDYYDPIKSISPWINVGLSAKNITEGFLDRSAAETLKFDSEKQGYPALAYENYKKTDEIFHGLVMYVPRGIDPKTNVEYRNHENAKDIFLHYDEDKKIKSYIKCTNRNPPDLKKMFCTQDIGLEPKMHVWVYISYPRYWLPHWHEIQRDVSNLIWSFRYEMR